WHFNRVVTGVRSNSSAIFTTHHSFARGWFEIFQLKPITMLSGNGLNDLVNVTLIFWVELLPDVDSYAINSYRYDPHLLARYSIMPVFSFSVFPNCSALRCCQCGTPMRRASA